MFIKSMAIVLFVLFCGRPSIMFSQVNGNTIDSILSPSEGKDMEQTGPGQIIPDQANPGQINGDIVPGQIIPPNPTIPPQEYPRMPQQPGQGQSVPGQINPEQLILIPGQPNPPTPPIQSSP